MTENLPMLAQLKKQSRLKFTILIAVIFTLFSLLASNIGMFDTNIAPHSNKTLAAKIVLGNSTVQKSQLEIPKSTQDDIALQTNTATINLPYSSNMLPVLLTRSDWRINDNLSEQLIELKQRFTDGDLDAGYILAMNLKSCLRAPIDQADFELRMQEATLSNETEYYISRLEYDHKKCTGVSATQRQQYHYYLQATAQQGHVPAQEGYSNLHEEFFMKSQNFNKLPRDEYIAKRDNFIVEKLTFLETAAEHGSLKAMTTLAGLYHSQNYGSKGWIKAYAYNQAILNFTDDNVLYRRYQWYIEKQGKNMSESDMVEALALSEQIVASVQSNGTLYSAK